MLLVTSALACVALTLYLWWRKEHFRYFTKLGIPGPKPSIIYGNFRELYKKGYRQCVEEWRQIYGPTYGFFNGFYPVLVSQDPEVMKQVEIKDFTNFADRGEPFGPPQFEKAALTELTGQRWKEARSILTPSFTVSKLKSMAPELSVIVDEFMENMDREAADGKEIDIYPFYQALTLDTICRVALGVRYNLQKDLDHPLLKMARFIFSFPIQWFAVIFLSFPSTQFLFIHVQEWMIRRQNEGKNVIPELKRQCAEIVKARRSNPAMKRNDLLQLMIEAQATDGDVTANQLTAGNEVEKLQDSKAHSKQGKNSGKIIKLTDDEVVANAFLVFLAGYETTSNSLALVTQMLLNFPDVQERVRSEIQSMEDEDKLSYDEIQKLKYLDAVIAETQRLYPSIFLFTTRKAAEDRQYGKIKIPKGTTVLIPTSAVHLDEAFWKDPKTFNPDRFLDSLPESLAWQPFGAGPRNCIGMRFAQMEMKITLVKLLRKYRLVATPNTDKFPMSFENTPVLLKLSKGVFTKLEQI